MTLWLSRQLWRKCHIQMANLFPEPCTMPNTASSISPRLSIERWLVLDQHWITLVGKCGPLTMACYPTKQAFFWLLTACLTACLLFHWLLGHWLPGESVIAFLWSGWSYIDIRKSLRWEQNNLLSREKEEKYYTWLFIAVPNRQSEQITSR